MNAVLKVTGTYYQPIDGKLSAADFCAEFYKRPIERKPGKYARKYLADKVGKTKRTARNYDTRAGIEATPNVDVKEVKSSESLPDMPEHKPVYLLVGGKKFAATKKGYERAAEFAKGARVTRVVRQANTYRLKDK